MAYKGYNPRHKNDKGKRVMVIGDAFLHNSYDFEKETAKAFMGETGELIHYLANAESYWKILFDDVGVQQLNWKLGLNKGRVDDPLELGLWFKDYDIEVIDD